MRRNRRKLLQRVNSYLMDDIKKVKQDSNLTCIKLEGKCGHFIPS